MYCEFRYVVHGFLQILSINVCQYKGSRMPFLDGAISWDLQGEVVLQTKPERWSDHLLRCMRKERTKSDSYSERL